MKSILIVDDEESLCEFLSIILRKEGYETVYTTQPEKAIDRLLRNTNFPLTSYNMLGGKIC